MQPRKYVGLGIYAAAHEHDSRKNAHGLAAVIAKRLMPKIIQHYGSDSNAFVAMAEHGWKCVKGITGELMHVHAPDGAQFTTYYGDRA